MEKQKEKEPDARTLRQKKNMYIILKERKKKKTREKVRKILIWIVVPDGGGSREDGLQGGEQRIKPRDEYQIREEIR